MMVASTINGLSAVFIVAEIYMYAELKSKPISVQRDVLAGHYSQHITSLPHTPVKHLHPSYPC